jgi:hypothetical protein
MDIKDKYRVGRCVRIHEEVKDHGGKHGTIASTGRQLGYFVVNVMLERRDRPIGFSPGEVVVL